MFEHGLYLAALLVVVFCLWLLDRRFRLAFYDDKRSAWISIAVGVLFFAVWDITGIAGKVFYIGATRYLTGIRLAPNFPLEELFFLFLLCYSTLILWKGAEKLWPATS